MPRKDQRPCDDRNLAWSTDKGRFGYQMLEKMGWKEGKGLGAKEDGSTEHIKIKKRVENQGVGTENSNPSRNWLSTSVAYESLLATLNHSYGSAQSTTTAAPSTEKKAAGEESKPASRVVGRPRKVLYSRMLRAKDLSNYSSEDKSAIFGGVPQGISSATTTEEKSTAQQDVGSESEDTDEKETAAPEQNEEDKGEEEDEDKDKDLITGVTTTTSTMSMQDYFKKRMAEMATKRVQSADGSASQPVATSGNASTERKQKKRKREDEKQSEAKSSESTEEKESKKKKKKLKTKKRKQEQEDAASKQKKEKKKKQKGSEEQKQKKKKKKSKKDKN